jgi:hypothetical protein
MKGEYWLSSLSSKGAGGPDDLVHLENGQQVEIGRGGNCTICLPDETVSRKHALLTTGTDGEWYVYDLRSSNGTYVNGVEIVAGTRLKPNDVVRLGPSGPALKFTQRFEAAAPKTLLLPPVAVPASVVVPGGLPDAPPATPGGELGPRLPPIRPRNDRTSFVSVFLGRRCKPLQRRHIVLGLVAIVPATLLMMLSAVSAAGRVGGVDVSIINLSIIVFFFVTSSSTALLEVAGRSKPWSSIFAAALVTALLSSVFDSTLKASGVDGEKLSGGGLIALCIVQQFIAEVPILAGIWIGQTGPAPLRQRFGVLSPLDGLSIGLGSAAGFELAETLADPNLASVIPLLIGDIAGQLALSGYIGCVLGLAVFRREFRMAVLLYAMLIATLLSASAKWLLQLGTLAGAALFGVVCFAVFVLLIRSIYQGRVAEGLSKPLSFAQGRRV